MKTFLIFSWIILVVLCLFDAYSTYVILGDGGIEMNPIMVWVMKKIGILNALIITRFIAISFTTFVIYRMIKKNLSVSEKIYTVCLVVPFIFFYIFKSYCSKSGAVAQWLSQGTLNPFVVGSIPTCATKGI